MFDDIIWYINKMNYNGKKQKSFKMETVEMLILFLLNKKDLYGY